MEDLFPVILVIFGIIASIASSRKEKEKKDAEERRKAAVAARVQEAKQRQTQQAASSMPAQPAMKSAPIQVAQPRVHAHLQPDCDTHDVPGSLGVTSMEGKDPCHEDQLTLERTFAEPAAQEGGLTFNWTGSSMVHAVVMQEVLTRPCERRAR